MDTLLLSTLSCITVVIFEVGAGVLTSIYVIIIILLDFHKKKNMRTGNKIRIALGLSNVCFSIITTANVFSGFYWPMIPRKTHSTDILYPLTMYCISSCSWFSAALSFFYFVKIVNVGNRWLAWAKTNISSIVSWVILVAGLVSFGSFFTVFFLIVPPASANNASVSSFSAFAVRELRRRFIYIVIVVTFLPLVTVLVTTISTAIVLKRHTLKMEQNMRPSGNIQLGTYGSAVFRMFRLLFFFALFYFVMLLFYLPVFKELSPGFWVSLIILSSFSSVQSVLLVLGNPKLKRAWRELVKCVRSCRH
ncbi:taste receptor type 2 member 40-like [Anomaloglossus baeobatrachus]|uniref:taste receptor type 2 member 40-like n=1 Tax=Anomaloglossus baeobatrachus TaxID=238106 RepID=UPI003F509558